MRAAALVVLSVACGAQEPPPEPAPAAQDPASHADDEPAHGHVRKPPPPPGVIAELPSDGGPEWNRLVFEGSQYLLQHAGNPVDWWPWGDAAFEEARLRDVPVFLSIGYSTCHWCHVIEHESFEDLEVAALMNENFVCVKVDREERPDVDQVYMDVTQAMTGRGGWPMTVVLNHERVPFFAGTYFPKGGVPGRIGMVELVPELVSLWREDRASVDRVTENVLAYTADLAKGEPGEGPTEAHLAQAQAELAAAYDPDHGGFVGGGDNKFPVPHNVRFLLRHHRRTGDEHSLDMALHQLEAMRLGGIWDHVGLGFHRYSTDRRWFLPHFEKMLYDQALVATTYLEAYQVTRDERYATVAREIFTYVLRDMTSPEGGFYSAEDADSEGEEGLFYTWTPEEVVAALGAEDGALFNEVHGIVPGGNYVDEGSQQRNGRSVPFLAKPLDELAEDRGEEPDELVARMADARATLFELREARVHPLKDDKVLTDWNGLMIGAFALGARALGEPAYEAAAVRAAEFVLRELKDEEGRLTKRWRAGEAAFPGVLEDHAYLVEGLLELYATTHEARWLSEAEVVADAMVAHFADEERGGFFLSADDGEELFVRGKEVYDGARPSGNGAAAFALLRLGRILARPDLEARAHGVLTAFSRELTSRPSAYTVSMMAAEFVVGPTFEVVVVGDPAAEDTAAALDALRSEFLPHAVVVFRPDGVEDAPIAALAPYTAAQTASDGAATLYLCRDYACEAPTTDLAAVLAKLAGDAD